MSLQNEVRDEVLRAFADGAHLGVREIMGRTGRDRIVYKYVAELVQEGVLAIVRREPTARKPRAIYALASALTDEQVAPF